MRKLLTAAVLTAITLPAYADPYFIVNVGKSSFETEDKMGDGIDESGTAFGFGIGSQVHENVALEFTYNSHGDVSGTSAVIPNIWTGYDYITITEKFCTEMTSLSAAAKFIAPLSDLSSVYATVGVERWDTDLKITDSIPGYQTMTFSDSDNGIDLFYGLGIQAALSDQVSVNADLTFHAVDTTMDIVGNDYKMAIDWHVLNIGLAFKF